MYEVNVLSMDERKDGSETPFLYDYFTPPSQGIQMT